MPVPGSHGDPCDRSQIGRRFVPLPTACEGGRFRGLRAAASLKRHRVVHQGAEGRLLPRPQGRGLIEAMR